MITPWEKRETNGKKSRKICKKRASSENRKLPGMFVNKAKLGNPMVFQQEKGPFNAGHAEIRTLTMQNAEVQRRICKALRLHGAQHRRTGMEKREDK